ncbi:cytochrome P450 [Chiua virens]|nr:cytochrome P450 [Chiua virens]
MSLIALLFAALLAYSLARFLKSKHPIESIPGPAKDSWFTGMSLPTHSLPTDPTLFRQLPSAVPRRTPVQPRLGRASQQLYVSDPLALHHIVVKEQHVYTETDMFITGNRLIFGEGLISTLGEQHKRQRKMLNPVFSLANMRDLLPIIQPIADRLSSILQSQLSANRCVFSPPSRSVCSHSFTSAAKEINVLPWLSRGALEYICQAALGHSFDALDVDKDSEYLDAIRNLAPSTLRLLMIRPFIPFIVRNIPLYWRNKILDWAPLGALRDLRHVVQIMDTTSKKIFAEKKAIMQGHSEPVRAGGLRSGMKGKDIMSIMLKANMSSSDADRLTDEELLGQMKQVPKSHARPTDTLTLFSTVIFAGFETTTTAICRILWILASKPRVQARLRSEVRDAKRNYALVHDITGPWEDISLPYDVLMELPYLDAIVRETLRVHPPTSLLSRTVRADTVLPLYRPIKSVSGEKLSAIAIPKGTTVIISILAANHNKDLWGEDASEWSPDRWLNAAGKRVPLNRHSEAATEGGESNPYSTTEKNPEMESEIKFPGVYANMMTFLGGGRACIGFKFAEMEISKARRIGAMNRADANTHPSEQVLTTLVSRIHFALPSTADEDGNIKEVYWKMNGLQVPVVRPPAGDDVTAQVPLDLRVVQPGDFV